MIEIKETQNPNIKKFISSDFHFNDTTEYHEMDEAKDFPLAAQLLQFPFVEKVLKSSDFIAIEKNDIVEWEEVEESLADLIENGAQETPKKVRPIEVYLESTPNPNVLKLVTNSLLFEGKAEAENQTEAENFPLAQFLLNFEYIDSVYVQENFISLTKTEDADWQMHSLAIRDLVSQYLREGKPIVESSYQPKAETQQVINTENFTAIEKEIQSILDEYIKPAVAGDGGNIDLVSYDPETKSAKMLLQGACSGCPSSTITLKNGIETLLKDLLPDTIENVEAINS